MASVQLHGLLMWRNNFRPARFVAISLVTCVERLLATGAASLVFSTCRC